MGSKEKLMIVVAALLFAAPALAQSVDEPAVEDRIAPAESSLEVAQAGEAEGEQATDEPAVEAAPEPADEPAAEAESDVELEQVGTEVVYASAAPYRNSTITYSNMVTAYSFSENAENTYNPAYVMGWTFAPRWYFLDTLSARIQWQLYKELTNSNSTTDYRETMWSDVLLDFVWDPFWVIPGAEISMGAGIRFVLPASKYSRAETMRMGLGGDFRLGRGFDVLDGLVLAYLFRYVNYFNEYTTIQRESNPYPCSPSDPACAAHGQTGDPSRNWQIFNAGTIQLRFAERVRPMSFTVAVGIFNTRYYEPTEATVTLSGGETVTVEHIDDPTSTVNSMYYLFEYGINITSWMSVAIGANTSNPQLDPSSNYRTPFFNRYTNLYLDMTFDIERIVASFR